MAFLTRCYLDSRQIKNQQSKNVFYCYLLASEKSSLVTRLSRICRLLDEPKPLVQLFARNR
jgi:Trp operon repressor